MNNIILPDLGEGIDKAEIACWHKKQGEHVEADEDIVELVTDKASFNVAAPSAGRLGKISVAAGQEAKIGDVLGVIE